MSNGAECCALEICCPDAATKRAKLTASMATFSGHDQTACGWVLDWMDDNNLTFAPKEFAQTVQAVVTMTRAHPL